MQEIKLESFVNLNYELDKRNRKAKEYSDSVAKRKRDTLITNIILCMIVLITIIAMIHKAYTYEDSYYKRTETKQSDGTYYIYVTEKTCTVTDVDNGVITVEYKGQLYSFYGNGYENGEQIVCQFTDAMEIVGVKER